MRIELKPNTVQRIENLAGMKMTTRCDKVINKAITEAEQKFPEKDNEIPQVKMEPEMLEMIQNG